MLMKCNNFRSAEAKEEYFRVIVGHEGRESIIFVWIILKIFGTYLKENPVSLMKINWLMLFLCFFYRASQYRIISSTNFNAQFNNNMYVTLLSSICFGPWHAHPQEEQLHKHSIWYPRSHKRLYTTPVESSCTVVPPEDGHVKARNISRIVMWHTCCYWIVH